MKKILSLLLLGAVLASCQPKQEQQPQEFKMPAVEDIVMYQVNPRVFAPSNSLKAVASRIDSIKALGVNVMWVMPIYPIGKEKSKNSPYSITDYTAVNPEFGTINDFKALVDSCHKHDMGIILDWVANHTAWDSKWMKEGHKDWYTQDEKGNVIFPPGTDWTDVADLNYDNKDMRRAMIDAMKFWVVEVGIDGFRCDVADWVPTDFWKEAITELRKAAGNRSIVMLAEGNGKQNFVEGGFDMNYAWDFMHAMRKVMDGESPVDTLFAVDKAEYDSLPAGKVKLRFTTNHDESNKATPVGMWGDSKRAFAAYVATVLLHGGALVYGSQEVDYPEPINFFHYVPVDWTANQDTYHNFQQLIQNYNENPALRKGQLKPQPSSRGVLVFEKSFDKDRFLVITCLGKEPVQFDLPADWQNHDATDIFHKDTILSLKQKFSVFPGSVFIFKY